jgi:hypothetical protein
MTTHLAMFITVAFLCWGIGLAGAGQAVTVSAEAPASISGMQGRISIVKGQRVVSVDIYDSQNITANDGVSEEDWFPMTAGQNVAYEIKLEVR